MITPAPLGTFEVIEGPDEYIRFKGMDTGLSGFCRPFACCHAIVEHNKHTVLPVPVGDSNSALLEEFKAIITRSI